MNMPLNDRRKYELRARAERHRETRERIVAATVALHREVGPARTTIADIARRAGVQRLTVYNHFPEPAQLLGACQGQFLAESPPPDLSPDGGTGDPLDVLERTLTRLYAWFRANEAMERHVHRDRHVLPVLDELLRRTADPRFDAVAAEYGSLLARTPEPPAPLRAMVRVALDFGTWALLAERDLPDAGAAALMRLAVAGVLSSR